MVICKNNYINNWKDFENDKDFTKIIKETEKEVYKMYDDAVAYFLRAQRKFPDSKNAPIYLHNRARILDNILLDKNNARLAFEELIVLYPKHQLSINAQLYLDNAFGKSNDELLKLIK